MSWIAKKPKAPLYDNKGSALLGNIANSALDTARGDIVFVFVVLLRLLLAVKNKD